MEHLKRLVASKYPIVCAVTWEERRLEALIKKLAESGFSSPFKFAAWSQTDGLVQDGKVYPESKDPVKALDIVMRTPDPTLFSFRDLQFFMNDQNPEVIRKLRDVFHVNKTQYKTMFIVSPLLKIPEILSKEVAIFDFPLPGKAEMVQMVEASIQSNKAFTQPVPEDLKQQFAIGCSGLTIDEARTAMAKAMIGKNTLTANDLIFIHDEKRNLVRRDGILEYIDIADFSLEKLGGLDNLKEWLNLRARFFTQEAATFGIDPPKGILLTGVPGCGKSVCVKSVASHWHLPLFRMDMDRIYGSPYPEEALRRIFKTVEAAAPSVLWIDEIEKGVAGYAGGNGSGTDARLFGMFLTWMQDKKEVVFVAATANEVDKLPPEMLRKGRFDEIFFVDLPNEEERKEIFAIHLGIHKQDASRFDMEILSKSTNGFTGSEIEQVVLSGMYDAFAAKRELTNNDLHKAGSRMVALSVTMAERIKELKRWAQYRAVKATKATRAA